MSLLDFIDEATFEKALTRLGTTPEEFWRMSGEDWIAVVDGYIAECGAYVARLRARNDQAEAAARITESVPPEHRSVPLYELGQRGVIDADAFRTSVTTLIAMQAAEEDDPNPHDDNVAALLQAMVELFKAGDR